MLDHVILHCVGSVAPAAASAAAGTPGTSGTSGTGVALAVTFEARMDRWLLFGPADFGQLKERLALCDHVSGFDLIAGGYPALYGKDPEEFRCLPAFRSLSGKTTDLLARAATAMGRQAHSPEFRKVWSLAAVAHATIDRVPADPGDGAARNVASGSWPAAASFALDSAALVKELVWFANKYGYLVGPGGNRVNVRGLGTWSPYGSADPVTLLEAEAGRGVPATQAPSSLAALLADADEVAAKAAGVLGK